MNFFTRRKEIITLSVYPKPVPPRDFLKMRWLKRNESSNIRVLNSQVATVNSKGSKQQWLVEYFKEREGEARAQYDCD